VLIGDECGVGEAWVGLERGEGDVVCLEEGGEEVPGREAVGRS
jgi:hypothetical protein